MGKPTPVIVQGDSREFDQFVPIWPQAAAITSPPYANIAAGAGGLNTKPPKKPGQQSGRSPNSPSQQADQHYGVGAITSPPYVSGGHHNDVFYAWNTLPRGGQRITKEVAGYGKSAGQIGTLKDGKVDAVMTSPPFLKAHGGERGIMVHGYKGKHRSDNEASALPKRHKVDFGRATARSDAKDETYWEAMLQVYSAMHRSLTPSGVVAIVVKDFVRNGKRMTLCDDTERLLTHIGFEPIERAHAMLMHEYVVPDLFEGSTMKRKNRKSFFRRSFENKLPENDPRRIDWEEVIFVRKP